MSAILTANCVNFLNIVQYPDIEIEEGQTVFITGCSGCGKSSLLKLFNGIISPKSGEIFYNGKNISEMDTIELRKEVLLIGQSVYLFDKTISENFAEYYAYRDLQAPSEEQMKKYLKLCCVDFPLDTVCTSMSGGERQRVYIAICLSFLPKILMLDEPTSALDSRNSDDLMQNLMTFCKENHITLIIVSHDKAIAEKFSDKIIVLEERG